MRHLGLRLRLPETGDMNKALGGLVTHDNMIVAMLLRMPQPV
jgi:hypothetical protein